MLHAARQRVLILRPCYVHTDVSVGPVFDRRPIFRELSLDDYEKEFSSLKEAEGIGRALGKRDAGRTT